MVCSLDHFLLSSHTLVAIVNLNLMIKWEHACEDIEPRGEGIMWDRYLHMESLTCWGMRLIISYAINVAMTALKGFSGCFENNGSRISMP